MGTTGHRLLSTFVLLSACDRDGASASPNDTPAPSESELDDWARGTEVSSVDADEEPEPLDTSFRVEGGLTQAQIQAVIDEEFTPIRACFDEALHRIDQVDANGAIVVRWVVGTKGDVAEAQLEGSRFGDDQTELCIVEAVRRWTFPAPKKKPATVHYPFYLRSY